MFDVSGKTSNIGGRNISRFGIRRKYDFRVQDSVTETGEGLQRESLRKNISVILDARDMTNFVHKVQNPLA